MEIEPRRPTATMWLTENDALGRDFVVGYVHGEFQALEAVLAHVRFAPERDRVFALGDEPGT